MTASQTVADVAAQYDNEHGDLTRGALARLAWRLARSGKTCERCREPLQLSAFTRDSRERDGLMRICRSCKRAANAASYRKRAKS